MWRIFSYNFNHKTSLITRNVPSPLPPSPALPPSLPELDVIEMAVYGDVIRPGKQCHCRTVAEMLGKVKTKNRMAACELPDKNTS